MVCPPACQAFHPGTDAGVGILSEVTPQSLDWAEADSLNSVIQPSLGWGRGSGSTKASLSLEPPVTKTHRKEDGPDSSKLAEKG